ncbi:MAG: polymer-forming cytoskeletal protein [Lawsonibacter sp.]|jgi:cytoskeletal protein CcmA (bactofilin family)|nr:polymer-forming cytoskeletal protein [Lawsonibacter sp.]
MGLFGGPSKQEPINPTPFDGDAFEEPFDSLPSLPKAHGNTIIAKGITFTGVIRGEGSVQVEGCVEGEIDLSGSVTVATTGLIQGPVTADIVRVAGDVQGSVTAREHLCLERTGGIHGDVATASLVVENGRLDGSSTMLAPAEPPKAPEPPAGDLQFGENYHLDDDI